MPSNDQASPKNRLIGLTSEFVKLLLRQHPEKWNLLFPTSMIFFKDFIYLFMKDTEGERQRHRQRAPCRNPDVGLDPGTPGSRPEPKADAKPLGHPGVPLSSFLMWVLTALNFFLSTA